MIDLAIHTSGLGKCFGDHAALEHIDLEVPRGVAFGFLGPNGAGKTTLIRLLLGLARPTSGMIRLLGQQDRSKALARVGAIVEEPRFHRHLTGRENLHVHAAARDRSAHGRVDSALERVGLGRRAGDKVGTYSLGMRQRLGVARCLVCDPELLILDEPVNGLDPAGILEFRSLIRELVSEGRTVLLSSHLLDEVEKTCDVAAIVDKGRVIAQRPIADLVATQTREIDIDAAPRVRAAGLLASVPNVARAAEHNGGIRVTLSPEAPVDREIVTDLGSAHEPGTRRAGDRAGRRRGDPGRHALRADRARPAVLRYARGFVAHGGRRNHCGGGRRRVPIPDLGRRPASDGLRGDRGAVAHGRHARPLQRRAPHARAARARAAGRPRGGRGAAADRPRAARRGRPRRLADGRAGAGARRVRRASARLHRRDRRPRAPHDGRAASHGAPAARRRRGRPPPGRRPRRPRRAARSRPRRRGFAVGDRRRPAAPARARSRPVGVPDRAGGGHQRAQARRSRGDQDHARLRLRRARAELFGGTLSAGPRDGGFEVRAVLPYEP